MKFKQQIIRILTVVLFTASPLTAVQAEESGELNEYTLEEVVVLSRHNIRAPLSSKGSVLDNATPYTWFNWSSNASELSLRGGILETEMGQYFRKWLESEELIPENYRPTGDEVRFYANAKQRTIATAQYFSSGFLPVANVTIETNQEYDKMDPVFLPGLTFVNEEYAEAAKKQMAEAVPDLSKEYELLSDVIGYTESDGYKNKELSDLVNGDVEFILETGKEPQMKGSLKTATSISDALVLQYYEEPDAEKAAFGHAMSQADWEAISRIKDTYNDVLFATPLIASNVAHPLLQEIDSELEQKNRKFTFLCGHDSNIGSVLAALDVKDYSLPNTIEKNTPIGSKVVFEKWKDSKNEEYIRVQMIYQSTDQLRTTPLLSLDNPPMVYTLSFNGLEETADGLYSYKEFDRHLDESIAEYDVICETYHITEKTSVPDTGVR